MSLIQLSPSNGDSLLINSGNFIPGKIVRTKNEVVFYIDEYGNKTGYRWLGTLPHTIIGISPSLDGGLSSTAWESIVTSNLYDNLKNENITLTGTAHIPTVEVSYGLPKGSLKVWKSGEVSTSNTYWLYSDGTVWGGIGTLSTIPTSPFTQLILQKDIIKYSYIIQTNGTTLVTVPYVFSDISVYLNGVLLNPKSGSYIISGSDVLFSDYLQQGDDLQFIINDVQVSNINNEFINYYSITDLKSTSPSGASLINTSSGNSIQSTFDIINNRVGKSVNIFDFMTDDEIEDVNSSSPTLDHSDAFILAMAKSNFIELPPVVGWYNFGDITLPNIFKIKGSSINTYTASSAAAINTMGSSIKKTTGASCVFKFNLYISFENINIYGNGSPWMLKRDSSADIQRISFNDCGLYGSTYGIGLSSGYCKEVDAYNCHIANNINAGWRNTIDSKMVGGYINANTGSGVQLMTGANDNTFIGVKNEWNSGIAWEFYGSIANNIIGGITDRAGNSGLSLKNGSRCTVTGGVWRRNGKDILGTRACTHFYVEGDNNQLIVSGIDTRTGANDDGSGDVTPNYVVTTGGSATTNAIAISNSSLSGFVTSGYSFSPTPATLRIEGNLYVDDYVNTGFFRKSNGQSYISVVSQNVAASSTGTFVLTGPIMSEYSILKRKISITVRNTSAGTFATSDFDVFISRNASSSNSAITVISGTEINSGSNIGTTGTSLVVGTPTVDSTGASISLSIQNVSTVQFSIQVYLK